MRARACVCVHTQVRAHGHLCLHDYSVLPADAFSLLSDSPVARSALCAHELLAEDIHRLSWDHMKINVLVSNFFHGVRVNVEFGTTVAKIWIRRGADRQLLGTSRTQPPLCWVEARRGVQGFPRRRWFACPRQAPRRRMRRGASERTWRGAACGLPPVWGSLLA